MTRRSRGDEAERVVPMQTELTSLPSGFPLSFLIILKTRTAFYKGFIGVFIKVVLFL